MLDPTNTEVRYENDIEGFDLPFKVWSQTEAEFWVRRYMGLRKRPKRANHERLGVYVDGQS